MEYDQDLEHLKRCPYHGPFINKRVRLNGRGGKFKRMVTSAKCPHLGCQVLVITHAK